MLRNNLSQCNLLKGGRDLNEIVNIPLKAELFGCAPSIDFSSCVDSRLSPVRLPAL